MIADVLCQSSSVGFGQYGVTPWLDMSWPCSICVEAPAVLYLVTSLDTSFNKYQKWPQNVISWANSKGFGGKAVLSSLTGKNTAVGKTGFLVTLHRGFSL